MNNQEFIKLVDEVHSKTGALLKMKGAEYSNDTDRLSNFKESAKLLGLQPEQVAMTFMHKHYCSIMNYIKAVAAGKTIVSSEPIEGRFHDLINYCYLTLALIEERNNAESAKSREALVNCDHGKYTTVTTSTGAKYINENY